LGREETPGTGRCRHAGGGHETHADHLRLEEGGELRSGALDDDGGGGAVAREAILRPIAVEWWHAPEDELGLCSRERGATGDLSELSASDGKGAVECGGGDVVVLHARGRQRVLRPQLQRTSTFAADHAQKPNGVAGRVLGGLP